jgi:hypothetical protein
MKSKEEIKSRIDRPMKWGEQYISALVWVLDNEGSAMCEANSNNVLADVRADIQELLQMIADIPCICDKIYKDRGLRAPDCPRCNWIEEDIVKKVGEHFS